MPESDILWATEWPAEKRISLPIDSRDIPNFCKWIHFQGYTGEYKHNGHDFAVYLNQGGEVVLGLPPETPVRSIADGIVERFCVSPWGEYGNELIIKHNGMGLASSYAHVVPCVQSGQEVRAGDIVARLYIDPPERYGHDSGRLVHLHFGLGRLTLVTTPIWTEHTDPLPHMGEITDLCIEPEACLDFSVPKLPNAPIRVANFKTVGEYGL